MEPINATVVEIDEKHFIRIENAGEKIEIPLSEDKPNEVKTAFNKLIIWVKQGEFEIKIEAVGADLFSQVAKEYIMQLNREIREVRGEMKDLGLVDDGD